MKYNAISLGLLGLLWSDLTEETCNHLTHLRLQGLKFEARLLRLVVKEVWLG